MDIEGIFMGGTVLGIGFIEVCKMFSMCVLCLLRGGSFNFVYG